MSVWIPRDISEIKPGCFSQSSTFQKPQEQSGAQVDPYHRFVKRLLKPRERDPELNRLMTGKDYVPRRKVGKTLNYETSDKGIGIFQSIGEERLETSNLKDVVRTAAREHEHQMKSGFNPGAAHKIYAWRDILEDREEKSAQYNCQPVPSSLYLPDQSQQLITIYHRGTKEGGGLHHIDGYWQRQRLGPPVYRDKWGLKIIDNLAPEPVPKTKPTKLTHQYHYQWPLVDSDTGHSIHSLQRDE